MHSVHPPTPFYLGLLNLLPNFQKEGGLDRTSIFTGGLLGKRGMTFLRGRGRGGSLQFLYNNELKFEIYNEKKSL